MDLCLVQQLFLFATQAGTPSCLHGEKKIASGAPKLNVNSECLRIHCAITPLLHHSKHPQPLLPLSDLTIDLRYATLILHNLIAQDVLAVRACTC